MDQKQKAGRYERIYSQVVDLLSKSNNPYSDMATVIALVHHKMNFFWTGFYLLHEGKLQVGPYQGSLACIDLKENTGVCWAGIQQAKTIIVPDVHQFTGHIACDSRSQSEIVVPLRNKHDEIIGVLDIDSEKLNTFDETDAFWLEKTLSLISF